MKKTGKAWLFVVAVLIFTFAYTAFFGVSTYYGDTENKIIKGAQDIRFGTDIRGGVDVTFMPADDIDAEDTQLDSAQDVIELRLVNLGITDYEVYTDYNKDRIIVRFPWKNDEAEFNPEQAIQEIGATAMLTFREGFEVDAEGKPTGVTADTIVIEGQDVISATAARQQTSQSAPVENVVQLKLSSEGAKKFAEATERLVGKGYISIWMDDIMISAPFIQSVISTGEAVITGSADLTEAQDLANKINAGSLPFALSAESYSTISPTLGANSLEVMVLAGMIAFLLVAAYMIFTYRLPGVIATIALVGQVAATVAFVSRYFTVFNSFTLTLPGIAGIILAIGMGVDANVITSERVKEEINAGKTLDGALTAGFKHGLSPIIDGNVTIIIVAVILMGSFGPTDGVFAKLLAPVFFAFGPSTTGTIYSFGYTLLTGVLLNFVFGVGASRVMLRSASKFKGLRKTWLYGGAK